MSAEQRVIPLFPLNTVLYPDGPLPLRIFEARYIDMISECLRKDTGFGIGLIKSGEEVGKAAQAHEYGTLARIADWHTRHDGLLGITAVGEQRYRILSTTVRDNQLQEAVVEMIPNEAFTELPEEYIPIADFLRQLVKQVPHLFQAIKISYDDARWVGCRLCELLPIPMEQKLHLLQLTEPIQRLERLRVLMEKLNIHY